MGSGHWAVGSGQWALGTGHCDTSPAMPSSCRGPPLTHDEQSRVTSQSLIDKSSTSKRSRINTSIQTGNSPFRIHVSCLRGIRVAASLMHRTMPFHTPADSNRRTTCQEHRIFTCIHLTLTRSALILAPCMSLACFALSRGRMTLKPVGHSTPSPRCRIA